MGSDPPHQQLVLSDIIHNMSPSPSINDDNRPRRSSHSPESLLEEDITRMKDRVADMGLVLDTKSQNSTGPGDMTSTEKELGGMVVKLLDSFVDPSQLFRQAELINWLGAQRDHLVQSFAEERRRWEAEREGWTRMAEALLSQRAKAGSASTQRDEELERQCAAYESENKALREKLHDSQARFSALESELNKLKPLLLMQPSMPFTSFSPDKLDTVQTGLSSDLRSSKAKRKPTPVGGQERDRSVISTRDYSTIQPRPLPDNPIQSQQRSEHYRQNSQSRLTFPSPLQPRFSAQQTPTRSIFSAAQTPSTHQGSSKRPKPKSKKSLTSNLLPLTADARTEHLLLAARKIGRDRANMMSGFMRRIEREKEMLQEHEAERMDRERWEKTVAGDTMVGGNTHYRKNFVDVGMSPGPSTSSTVTSMPKTPKRGGTTGGQSTTHFLTPTLMTPRSDFYLPTTHTPNSFVFVGTPAVAPFGNATSTPRPIGHPAQSTTHSTKKSAQTPTVLPASASHTSNHPTPLASLLSAAKSMMDDETNDTGAKSNGRKRTGALEPPESPLPKRRRVANGRLNSSEGSMDMLGVTATPSSDRVRSALDVLADQAAAAFDSGQQSPTKPPTKVSSRSKGKDKDSTRARSGVSGASSINYGLKDDATPKGKARFTHESHSHISTGSPRSTRSRSKALLNDRPPKESTKAPRRKKNKSLDSSQQPVPTPRVIFSPGIRSPMPPLPPLSPLPLSTPLDAVSPDNSIAHEDATTSIETVAVEEGSIADANIFLANGIAPTPFKSPIPSNAGHDSHIISSSGPASLDMTDPCAHGSQPSAATPNTVVESPAQTSEAPEVTNPLSATLSGQNQGGEVQSAVGEESDPRVGKDLKRGPVSDGEEGAGGEGEGEGQVNRSHAAHSPHDDNDGTDTDADAEGEMDVDTIEEAIIIPSRLHDPLYLDAGMSSSQPEIIDPAEVVHDEGKPKES
ncbi:hypothetical protein P691DRAFT_791719 [Macrolepiota fuliginosa MF-IS2]|uniref:Uncharacterized protein n=1 Tax=Macrolepiota fuliginosa MF-IS2 TaxID=1400762 RepID=A0A9P5XGZ4_9AGAR|nr:hypothetical protein P691DRAFT_791719 [Macrolepiota fuliginosa MF-IS2]